MVILNSALFPLFSVVGGDPFTWRAGVDGAPADEDGEDAVAVAMGPVCFAWWDNEQRELGGNKEGLERSVCVWIRDVCI